MRKQVLFIAAVTVSLLLPACNQAVDIDLEKKSVQQVFEKYLESVKTADPTIASEVWLQSPDISAVTPLARFKGWDSVRNDLYVNILQKAFSERSLQTENLAINVSGNVAWTVYDWTFTAKLADGMPYSAKGWESQVYQKIDGKWLIVHLHYSSPPPLP